MSGARTYLRLAAMACCVFAWESDFDFVPLAASKSRSEPSVDVIQTRVPGRSYAWMTAHVATGPDVRLGFRVLPPSGGCGNVSAPRASAAQLSARCSVVTNGGFFVPHPRPNESHSCLGSIVARSQTLASTETVVPSLVVSGSSEAFVGYINQSDMTMLNPREAISGQGWLVRKGRSYIRQALREEDMSLQRSGSAQTFSWLLAPRTAIGIDSQGRVFVAVVDGLEMAYKGVNLFEFANFLVGIGAEYAINLDGGGSSSMYVNRTLVNVPSDTCVGGTPGTRCARAVSTAICLEAPREPSFSPSRSRSFSIKPTPLTSASMTTVSATSTPSLFPADDTRRLALPWRVWGTGTAFLLLITLCGPLAH